MCVVDDIEWVEEGGGRLDGMELTITEWKTIKAGDIEWWATVTAVNNILCKLFTDND